MDNKNSRPILIGIIIILAISLIVVLMNRGSKTSNEEMAIEKTTGNEEMAIEKNANSDAASANSAKPDYMKPQMPSVLSDAQKAELKAGSEDHQAKDLTFNISGGSFFFAPNEIRVKQGDKVKIVFNNVGGTHNFILPDYKVESKTIQTGTSDTVEFVADKKGTFEFYCSVGNGYHRQMGQIGVLLVE